MILSLTDKKMTPPHAKNQKSLIRNLFMLYFMTFFKSLLNKDINVNMFDNLRISDESQ